MSAPIKQFGRYALYEPLAVGGMATVHLGKLTGPDGFSRTVAIKRLHEQFAAETEFVSMLLDEARLVTRIRHPNVVQILDVIRDGADVLLVMEYVHGESLSRLMQVSKRLGPIPLPIISGIMIGALQGLHAAHEARSEDGELLNLVHRDISPQNIMVGLDGIPRVLDFGIAKASGRIQTTDDGVLKGKLAYMAPEQLRGAGVTRSCDIYAAGVMLWELLTGERLFFGDNEGVVVNRVLEGKITPPSHYLIKQGTTLKAKHQHLMAQLDQVVLRAAHRDPAQRFATAKDMALELESCVAPATVSQVAEWVEQVGAEVLQMRAHKVAEIESLSATPAPFDRPSDVHRLLTESNGATVPLGASSHAELQPQHVRPSEPPRPPSAHPGTLSSSASYVGLPAAAPAQKRGNGWLVAVGIAVIVLFLGFGSIVAIKMKEHGAELGGLPDADTSSTPTAATAPPPPSTVGVLDLFDAGETLNLDDAGAPGTVTPPPSASATATSKPPVVHWPPTPATVRPPPTIPTKAADPCLTNPYFFEDGIKKVRPECRSKIN